jgi:hypothetical protein
MLCLRWSAKESTGRLNTGQMAAVSVVRKRRADQGNRPEYAHPRFQGVRLCSNE